jgi:hypothetical protein
MVFSKGWSPKGVASLGSPSEGSAGCPRGGFLRWVPEVGPEGGLRRWSPDGVTRVVCPKGVRRVQSTKGCTTRGGPPGGGALSVVPHGWSPRGIPEVGTGSDSPRWVPRVVSQG